MSLALLMVLPSACRRETRAFRGPAAEYAVDEAYAASEGKRLFQQFNCVGCHSHGGGGMGPPLMDTTWLYGGSPLGIYSSIAQGRPRGMPSFARRLTPGQTWQLVAYVRSMSGGLRKDVAPGRDDGMQVRSQEQSTEKAP